MALVHQLHQLFPGWAADLNARDGAVIAEIRYQLEKRAAWTGAFLRPCQALSTKRIGGGLFLVCGRRRLRFQAGPPCCAALRPASFGDSRPQPPNPIFAEWQRTSPPMRK
jgi:hypothetical protein